MRQTMDSSDSLYWICPWCLVANFRDFEGLDECVGCGSETRTRFPAFGDRIVVILAREPRTGDGSPRVPNVTPEISRSAETIT